MKRTWARLEDADIIPYYYLPACWLRWHWFPYKHHPKGYRDGLEGRLGPVGFCVHWPNGGVHHNGSKWQIFFRYRPEIEEMFS